MAVDMKSTMAEAYRNIINRIQFTKAPAPGGEFRQYNTEDQQILTRMFNQHGMRQLTTLSCRYLMHGTFIRRRRK